MADSGVAVSDGKKDLIVILCDLRKTSTIEVTVKMPTSFVVGQLFAELGKERRRIGDETHIAVLDWHWAS